MLGFKRKETETTTEAAETPKPEKPKADIARFTKRKPWKKRIIILVVVVGVGFLGWKLFLDKPPMVMPVMSTALQKEELINSISLTGTVESADASYIYSTLNSTINEITVKVGDKVEAGDVLAKLDTSDLELNIAQAQADLNQTAKLNEHNLNETQIKLEDAKNDITNDYDAQLVTANNALKSAEQNLNDARRDLNDHKDDLEYADNVMNQLEKKLNRARQEMNDAERAVNANRDPDKVAELNAVLEEKTNAYDAIYEEWNENDHLYGSDLTSYSRAYRNARVSYENALANQKAAENDVYRSLDTLERSIKGQEISGDTTYKQLSLKKLQKDLTDSTVTAPVSGTVTAVYAKEGAPGSGLLFVVEDTDNLVIKTTVKEYDISSVEEGMPAEIKSDATGEEMFAGKVSKIYPTAVKATDGTTKTDGGVEFETEVSLDDPEADGLKVGMNVRMNVITAKKPDVWAVPFDAVGINAEGKDIVYVVRPNEEGKMVSKAVLVTTGMETDFYIEITSDQLADGDQVLSDASTAVDGGEVNLMPGVGAPLAGAEGASESDGTAEAAAPAAEG